MFTFFCSSYLREVTSCFGRHGNGNGLNLVPFHYPCYLQHFGRCSESAKAQRKAKKRDWKGGAEQQETWSTQLPMKLASRRFLWLCTRRSMSLPPWSCFWWWCTGAPCWCGLRWPSECSDEESVKALALLVRGTDDRKNRARRHRKNPKNRKTFLSTCRWYRFYIHTRLECRVVLAALTILPVLRSDMIWSPSSRDAVSWMSRGGVVHCAVTASPSLCFSPLCEHKCHSKVTAKFFWKKDSEIFFVFSSKSLFVRERKSSTPFPWIAWKCHTRRKKKDNFVCRFGPRPSNKP